MYLLVPFQVRLMERRLNDPASGGAEQPVDKDRIIQHLESEVEQQVGRQKPMMFLTCILFSSFLLSPPPLTHSPSFTKNH